MRKKGVDREALKIRDMGGWMGAKIEKDGDVGVDRDYNREPGRPRSRGSHGSGNRYTSADKVMDEHTHG